MGREDTLHLQSDAAACVDEIQVHDHSGKRLGSRWKLAKPNEIEVKISLKDAAPGAATMELKQAGLKEPDPHAELCRPIARPGISIPLIINSGDHAGPAERHTPGRSGRRGDERHSTLRPRS